jgi:hypothetical protein
MKGYEIKFCIYAESEQEAEDARQAIVGFIDEHAQQGRAVTGKKIADAVGHWKDNVIVRNKIINYFK